MGAVSKTPCSLPLSLPKRSTNSGVSHNTESQFPLSFRSGHCNSGNTERECGTSPIQNEVQLLLWTGVRSVKDQRKRQQAVRPTARQLFALRPLVQPVGLLALQGAAPGLPRFPTFPQFCHKTTTLCGALFFEIKRIRPRPKRNFDWLFSPFASTDGWVKMPQLLSFFLFHRGR